MNNNILNLMFISLGMIFCGFILIFLSQYPTSDNVKISDFSYIPWLVIEILVAFFIQLIMKKSNINNWFFTCAFFLSNFGMLAIGRLESSLIIPQIRWIIVGMIVFFIVFRFYNCIKKLLAYKLFWGILCFSLFIITILLNQEVNGALNYVSIAGIRIQPLEFAKVLLLIFTASYYGNDSNIMGSKVFLFVLFLVSIFLFIFTNNVENSLIVFCFAIIMTYIKTGKKLSFIIPLMLFIISMFINYFMFSDIKIMFDNWLNPWININDDSRKIIDFIFSLSAGSVWGTGFATGHPSEVFAVIAEEFGLIGIIFLILIYILFFYQCFLTAFNLKNECEVILAYGIGILYFIQLFITISSALNFLPLINNCLPFMSYGGSFIVSNFILLGIIISLSRKENCNG